MHPHQALMPKTIERVNERAPKQPAKPKPPLVMSSSSVFNLHASAVPIVLYTQRQDMRQTSNKKINEPKSILQQDLLVESLVRDSQREDLIAHGDTLCN